MDKLMLYVPTILSIMAVVVSLITKFNDTEHNTKKITELACEIATLRVLLETVRIDFAAIKVEVEGLKSEVGRLRNKANGNEVGP